MMPPVYDANDNLEAALVDVTTEAVVHVDDTTSTTTGNANAATQLLLAPMIKANHNTVVVVAESVTQRPGAVEARRRRKERLLKQSKQQQQAKNDIVTAASASAAAAATNGGTSGAIVVDHNAIAEAATLAAVVAAAAAAVDASVDLVSAEVIDNAVNAAAPTRVIDVLNNEMDGSNSAAGGVTDIPFLDDADIAATAAAVAMNSVTTAATTANSNNAVTTTKNKAPKRKRQVDKNKSIDIAKNNDDSYDDYNDMDNEEDDYDEDGNPLSGSGNNKKTQIRYDPSIPMEKEQLAAWRREARRVRNRESAAASRQRIRGRITELEDELDVMKQKYERAMQRIQQLQGQSGFHPTE